MKVPKKHLILNTHSLILSHVGELVMLEIKEKVIGMIGNFEAFVM